MMQGSGRSVGFLVALPVAVLASVAGAAEGSTDTQLFSFRNNPWINEHHFLYQTATACKDAAIDDCLAGEVFEGLNDAERSLMKEAIAYYRDDVIARDLLFNGELYRLKTWLSDRDPDTPLPDREEEAETVAWLNRVSDLYAKHFWPAHGASNTRSLEANIEILRKVEKQAASRLVELSGADWPEGPVRVDLTYHANWAGAYTTTRPAVHVVMGTAELSDGGEWVELVFHEASHGLIGNRRGAIAEAIAESAAGLDAEVPRNLWHAILFYLAGRVTEDLIEAHTDESYEIYMFQHDVFAGYHDHVREHIEPYVAGESGLAEAVRATVASVVGE